MKKMITILGPTASGKTPVAAHLAAKIGGGGLGEIIFTGLGLNRSDLLWIGGILVAVLSLGSGILFDIGSKRIIRWK